MLRGCLLFVFVVVVFSQDGSRGYVVSKSGQFLMPTREMRNGFTLGARQPLLSGAMGLDFAYNCTNGVADWGRIGSISCSLTETQSPIDINENVVAPIIENDAANTLIVDFNSNKWLASNEYLLNITTATQQQQQKQQQQQQQQHNNNKTSIKHNNGTNTTKRIEATRNEMQDSLPKKSRVLWREDGAEFEERQEFFLDSVVFHSPGEHTIRGVRFGMEIQFYLTAKNGSKLAIAVLCRVSNPEFVSEGLLKASAQIEKQLETQPTAILELNPAVFLPRLEGFWKYQGSQTTPPCATNTDWLVMHHPVNVTQSFQKVVARLVHSRYFGGNARPVQEKTPGFKVTSFRAPPFPGEILFEPSTSLTPNLRKIANNNNNNNNHNNMTKQRTPNNIAWTKEPNVVDIAQAYAEAAAAAAAAGGGVGGNEMEISTSDDPWGTVINGRKLARDNGAVPVARMIPAADENVRSTIFGEKYTLLPSCDRTYTFENRFVPFGLSRDKPNVTGIYVPPPLAPGSHLLTDNTNLPKQTVSASEIREQVEQATVRTTEVIRVLPAELS